MVAVVYTVVPFTLSGGIDLIAAMSAGQTPGGLTGDSFVNTGREIFVHINKAAGPKNVTFSENACNYGVEHDHLETTTAGTATPYGPFPVSQFGSSIPVAYNDITSVTVIVYQAPVVG